MIVVLEMFFSFPPTSLAEGDERSWHTELKISLNNTPTHTPRAKRPHKHSQASAHSEHTHYPMLNTLFFVCFSHLFHFPTCAYGRIHKIWCCAFEKKTWNTTYMLTRFSCVTNAADITLNCHKKVYLIMVGTLLFSIKAAVAMLLLWCLMEPLS